jgi:subtilisin
VKVAVLDSGIDYTHPDLAANYAGGWDFVNNDGGPWDDCGHGTAVAGSLAALADGAGVVGVAPAVQL